MALYDRFSFRRGFSLPEFELAPLEFEPAGADELLLDEVVASIAELPDPQMPSAAVPTAGELHESIERHLRASNAPAQADPVDELRDALAQLRRSIG